MVSTAAEFRVQEDVLTAVPDDFHMSWQLELAATRSTAERIHPAGCAVDRGRFQWLDGENVVPAVCRVR